MRKEKKQDYITRLDFQRYGTIRSKLKVTNIVSEIDEKYVSGRYIWKGCKVPNFQNKIFIYSTRRRKKPKKASEKMDGPVLIETSRKA